MIKFKAKEKFILDKDIVWRKIQSATTQVHLSIDIWTSLSSYLHLAVCAHFLDTDEQSYSILLALPQVIGHSGEHQWEVVLPVLWDYGIVRKIGAVTSDNSGTNDMLCHAISAYLSENEKISWSVSVCVTSWGFLDLECDGLMGGLLLSCHGRLLTS